MRTGRRTGMTKLIFAFRNSANASKNQHENIWNGRAKGLDIHHGLSYFLAVASVQWSAIEHIQNTASRSMRELSRFSTPENI
jgi:hypothetical protein